MMRFLVRVDAGPGLGMGHLARALTLAGDLRQAGHSVTFVGRYAGAHTCEALRSCGFPFVELPQSALVPVPLPFPEWQHPQPEVDAEETLRALGAAQRFDWLVVDVYALGARWAQRMRALADRVMVIDDLANREYDCDLLLDQNFFQDGSRRYDSLLPAHCETLLGPHYALLRPDFAAARAGAAERSGRLSRVLVSFGAEDSARLTLSALQALEQAQIAGLAADVVISREHPDFSAVVGYCRARAGWRVHVQPANMVELMARADVALGAAGATSWERCCLSLPTVLVSLEDNQYPIARDLAEHGACVFVGRSDEFAPSRVADVLRGLASAPALVRALGRRAGALVDGRGASRVTRRLLVPKLSLRRARPQDCAAMYEWRNAEETRRHALDPSAIAYETHLRWFERALANPATALLVAEQEGRPVGVLRYDLDGVMARVSIYVVPGHAGRGLGTTMLKSGARWLHEHYPAVGRLVAEIKPDNAPSLGAFVNAGFTASTHVLTLALPNDSN